MLINLYHEKRKKDEKELTMQAQLKEDVNEITGKPGKAK